MWNMQFIFQKWFSRWQERQAIFKEFESIKWKIVLYVNCDNFKEYLEEIKLFFARNQYFLFQSDLARFRQEWLTGLNFKIANYQAISEYELDEFKKDSFKIELNRKLLNRRYLNKVKAQIRKDLEAQKTRSRKTSEIN